MQLGDQLPNGGWKGKQDVVISLPASGPQRAGGGTLGISDQKEAGPKLSLKPAVHSPGNTQCQEQGAASS
ncbi:hypothetical protein GKC28_09395 [Leisingera sp. ANG59]|nr:hypothetical protein [Leisingera sp. ANG59]